MRASNEAFRAAILRIAQRLIPEGLQSQMHAHGSPRTRFDYRYRRFTLNLMLWVSALVILVNLLFVALNVYSRITDPAPLYPWSAAGVNLAIVAIMFVVRDEVLRGLRRLQPPV